MWQKCPICDGEGRKQNTFTSSFKTCTTCNGMKIINELTGLPPKNIPILTSESNKGDKDFRDGNMESQQEYFGN